MTEAPETRLSLESIYKIFFALAQMLKAGIPALTILDHLKDEHPIVRKIKEKLIVGTPIATACREASVELNLSVEEFPPKAIAELWEMIQGLEDYYKKLFPRDKDKWLSLLLHHISEDFLLYLYTVAECMEYDLYLEFFEFLRLDSAAAPWLSKFKLHLRAGKSVRGAIEMLAEENIDRSLSLALFAAMEGNEFEHLSDAMKAHQDAQPPFSKIDLGDPEGSSMDNVVVALKNIQPCPHVTLVQAFQLVAQDSPCASGPLADLLHSFEWTGNLGILDNAIPDRMLRVLQPKR